jgi:hypothetical protein
MSYVCPVSGMRRFEHASDRRREHTEDAELDNTTQQMIHS